MLDAKTEYWFPMRVTYGRQTIAKDFLDTIAIRTFLPTVAAAGYLLFPDFVTFLLRTNTFLDNHTLIAFTHCRGGLHALPQKMSQPI